MLWERVLGQDIDHEGYGVRMAIREVAVFTGGLPQTVGITRWL
jgi:hypothetical protein